MGACPSCSAGVAPIAKFCTNCGQKLDGEPNQTHASKAVAVAEDASGDEESATVVDPEPAAPKLSNKIIVIAGALVGLAAIIIPVSISSFNKAETERSATLGQNVADACSLILAQKEETISSAEVSQHWDNLNRVSMTVLDQSGNQIGAVATCNYSLADGFFYPEDISWKTQIDGGEVELVYDRASNTLDVKRQPVVAATPAPAPSNSNSCEDSFRAAAAVPLSRDNNREIAATTEACSGVDEWWKMLKQYPDVFGVTYLLESEKGMFVGSACLVGAGSPVCTEAALLGLTF